MVLVLIETSGNQAFVFSTNRLRLVEGASELIKRMPQWFDQAVPAGADVRVHQKLSGKVLFSATEDVAREVIRGVTRQALVEAPGLGVTGCWVDEHADDLADAADVMHELYRLHARHRTALPAPSHRYAQLPFVAICPESGEPAVAGPQRHGAAVRAALEAAARRRGAAEDPEELTSELSKIDESFIAVIHADGNGFGNVFTGMAATLARVGVTTERPLDLVLEVAKALSELLARAVAGAWADACAQHDVCQRRDVVIGGDDLTVIVPGRLGVRLAHAYLQAFERRCHAQLAALRDVPLATAARVSGAPLTVGRAISLVTDDAFSSTAGVAITKTSFPLSLGYALAEALASRGKEEGRRAAAAGDGRLPGLVDVHVLFDSALPNASAMLAELERGMDGVSWRGGPYVSTGSAPGLVATERLLATLDHFGGGARPSPAPSEGPRTAPRTVLFDLIRLVSVAVGQIADDVPMRTLQQLRRVAQSPSARARVAEWAAQLGERRPGQLAAVRAILEAACPDDALLPLLSGNLRSQAIVDADGRAPACSDLVPPRPAGGDGATYVLRLTLLGAIHVGTGQGGPWIDRSTARFRLPDGRDTVYIPAKSLTGVLREACELAAELLDGEPGGPWSRFAADLFGNRLTSGGSAPTSPARLCVRPAFPIAATTLGIRAGTVIDPETGVAADDQLVVRELVEAPSAELRAVITVDSEVPSSEASWLLLAGCQLVDAIGARKSRGLGACRAELLHPDLQPIGLPSEEQLASASPVIAPRPPAPIAPLTIVPRPQHHGPIWLDLHVEPLLPLVVTDRVVGNQWRALEHVPGRLLLPLLHRFLDEQRVPLQPAWLQDGSLVVTPATAVLCDGTRTAPAPMAIGRPKQTAGRPKLMIGSATSRQQLKSVGGWWPIDPARWRDPAGLTVRRGGRLHVDATERGEGRLFTYEYIEPHQRFAADVRLPGDVVAALGGVDATIAAWRDWLASRGECRLGRSSKDDYGLASITGGVRTKAPSPQIGELGGRPATVAWLTSPFTGRAPSGRPAADATLVVDALIGLIPGAAAIDLMARAGRVDGWHVGWGLPQPSVPVVAAGSCVLLDLSEVDDAPARLRHAAEVGIGLRRAEGYGQLQFFRPDFALSEEHR